MRLLIKVVFWVGFSSLLVYFYYEITTLRIQSESDSKTPQYELVALEILFLLLNGGIIFHFMIAPAVLFANEIMILIRSRFVQRMFNRHRWKAGIRKTSPFLQFLLLLVCGPLIMQLSQHTGWGTLGVVLGILYGLVVLWIVAFSSSLFMFPLSPHDRNHKKPRGRSDPPDQEPT